MRTTTLILTSLAAICSTAALANSGSGAAPQSFDQLFASIGIPPSHTATDACPDYSGTWTAKCDLGSYGPLSETVTIDQRGCDFLVIDGQYLGIGGGYTVTTVSPKTGLHTDATVDWAADQKSLIVKKHVEGRKLGERTFFDAMATATLSLSGETLKESGSFQISTASGDQLTSQTSSNFSCGFERQR